MSQDLSPKQSEDVLILERVTSIFSVAGCLFIFVTFLFSKKFRRPVNRLIFFASWGNLLMNIATLMSISPMQVAEPKESPLCRFQGFLIQFFLPADAFWNLSMAINVYLTVYYNWDAERLRKLESIYLGFNYGVTFLIALVFVFVNEELGDNPRGRMYGPATLWCWVDSQWEDFRIWLCYAPAWIAILAIFVIYALAWRRISQQRRAIASSNFEEMDATAFVGNTPGDDIKCAEIRVTTELSRHSFVSPVVTPHMPTDVPEARKPSRASYKQPSRSLRSNHSTDPSSYVFNPFRLDPKCNLGFTPYSVTIERHEDASAIKRRNAAAEANTAAWAYTQTALLYFVSLLITWVPSSMNRVYSLINKSDVSFPFSVMAGLVLPLMGFWNAVIYIVTSWDAVTALFLDIANGRVDQFRLPSMKRKGPPENRARGRGWSVIQGRGGERARAEDQGCELRVVADGKRRPSADTETEITPSKRSRDNGSTSTARSGPAWPYRSKKEEEIEEHANR